MATVTQTITSTVVPRNWKRPPDPYIGPIPFAEFKATASDTILALDSLDVGVYSFSTILPTGYAYRLVEHRLMFAGVSETDLDHLGTSMEWVFTENQVTTKRFMTYNVTPFRVAEQSIAAIQVRNPAITNDFVTEYSIASGFGMATDLVDATLGQSVNLGTIVDPGGNDTGAIDVEFYARYLAYTVEQLNAGAVWSPVPVVS